MRACQSGVAAGLRRWRLQWCARGRSVSSHSSGHARRSRAVHSSHHGLRHGRPTSGAWTGRLLGVVLHSRSFE
eukprot:10698996-Alexandrium_andersonii.AAC.1